MLKMYIVINSDAKMKPGKIASQVGHAVMQVTEQLIQNKDSYMKYKYGGQAKIILKANDDLIHSLSNQTNIVIYDMGLTQVPTGTLTAIGFMPMTETNRDQEFPQLKNLKLL